MANKTYIPAFQAKVGDWKYYICEMKYAEVARSVSFAFELGGNKDLSTLIQRGLSNRTQEITNYLLNSEHRFLGSLIIATWGGDPEYISLRMDDPEGILSGIDREFGVLTLDGTHSFFALDGQHRLKAIKDALKANPALGKEDICVLLVTHHDTPEGRERTQRLFTNINRNARTTTPAENIALDVDDSFAIITRRLLTEHAFLAQDKRVRIFIHAPNDGEFTLAGKNIPKTDPNAWTSITVLYDLSRHLSWGIDSAVKNPSQRPNDELLDQAYDTIAQRFTDLLEACGNVPGQLTTQSARELRAPRDEATGHAFMRPVVQQAVARTCEAIIDQNLLDWTELNLRLSHLSWHLADAPWTAVYNTSTGKMVTAKENTKLLDDLLRCHLAPESKAQIKRARKDFADVVHAAYPFAEKDLALNLPDDSHELPPGD